MLLLLLAIINNTEKGLVRIRYYRYRAIFLDWRYYISFAFIWFQPLHPNSVEYELIFRLFSVPSQLVYKLFLSFWQFRAFATDRIELCLSVDRLKPGEDLQLARAQRFPQKFVLTLFHCSQFLVDLQLILM